MRFARRTSDPRLTPIIRRVAGPVRVGVRGREGVGRGTVAAALAGAGVTVTTRDDPDAEVTVLVVAEAVKPEDTALLVDDTPTLAVLNKADLGGVDAAGARAVTGVPTVPMIGLLATAELDDELLAALRLLTVDPADLTSTDAFVRHEHQLPQAVRARLLAVLDRFGITCAVQALHQGSPVSSLPVLFRRLSGIDDVLEQLAVTAAPVRYQRVRAALTELRAGAVADAGWSEFLVTDDTVIAVMAAAVEVVESAGLTVDGRDDAVGHLHRALHWQQYSRGPVNALHRTCGTDISRGSLRLLARAHPGGRSG